MSLNFDVVIIGGGPAGYFAAEEAGKAGLKTVVIEKKHMGGTCLNEGCVPTKTLLNSSKIYSHAKHGEAYGVIAGDIKLDHAAAVARKNSVIKKLVSGVERSVKGCGATIVKKEAYIKGKCADGFVVDAEGEEYVGKNLIIATGSVATLPPIPGLQEALESGFCVTNRELLNIPEAPKSMVILGAGVIGLEFAAYFAAAGTEVTIIEMLPQVGVSFDRDLADMMQRKLERSGVKFMLSTKVTSLTADGVCWECGEEKGEIKAELALACLGRKANPADIGLGNIGVLTERGAVLTDKFMKTNVPGVYAAGDINGKYSLAHTAYREGAVAVNNILGKRDIMRYDAIPSVIYADPEAATVGYNEAEAKAAGLDVKTVKIDANYSGRFLAENDGGEGVLKIVADKKTGRVLGMQACGTYASEYIAQGAVFIEMGMTMYDLREIVFPHPTVCELIREAAFKF